MFNSIRTYIGNGVLRSRVSRSGQRERKACNFEEVKHVGIIYDATNRNTYQAIKKFIRYLKEERKKVSSVGFINSKDESQFIESKLNEQYYTRKDLNGILLPKGKGIQEFTDEKFDILIDLNTTEHLSLKYIFAMSRARFKVASDLPYQRLYGDLTIDTSQQRTVEYFIIQIKHYLKLVNQSKRSYAV